MPHIDQPGRGTGESFDAQNNMIKDFHSVMSEDPSSIVKQIDTFRGATDTTSLQGFPSAENLMDKSSLGSNRLEAEETKVSTSDSMTTSSDKSYDGGEKLEDNVASSTTVEIDGGVRVSPDDLITRDNETNRYREDFSIAPSDTDRRLRFEPIDEPGLNPKYFDKRYRFNDEKVSEKVVGDKGEQACSSVEQIVSNQPIPLPEYANETKPCEAEVEDIPSETEDCEVEDIPSETEDCEVEDIPSETEDCEVEDIPSETEDCEVEDIPNESDVLDDPNDASDNQNSGSGCYNGLTINITNIAASELPNAFSNSLNCGFDGDFSQVPHSTDNFLRNIQGLFRPTDARFAQPRSHNPVDFISNLSDIVNGGQSDSGGLPSPEDFLQNLQRSLVPPGMERFLPQPPSPDNFLQDLTGMMGYTGDNQSIFPRLPRPDQFLAGLGRSLGFDSSPIGDSQAFRTLGCQHAMNGNMDFVPNSNGSPIVNIINFIPDRPENHVTDTPSNPFVCNDGVDIPWAGESIFHTPPHLQYLLSSNEGINLPFVLGRPPHLPVFDGNGFPNPLSDGFNIPNPFSNSGRPLNMIPTPFSNGLDVASLIPGAGSIPSPMDLLPGAGSIPSPMDLLPGAGSIPWPMDLLPGAGSIPWPMDLLPGAGSIPSPMDLLPGAGSIPSPMDLLPGSGSIPSPLDFLLGKGSIQSPVGVLGTGITGDLVDAHLDFASAGANLGLEVATVPLNIAEGAIDVHTDIMKAPLKLAEGLVGSDSPAAIPIKLADNAIDLHEKVLKAPVKLAKKAKDFFKKLF